MKRFYTNIITQTNSVSNLLIDDQILSNAFTPFQGDTTLSYAQLLISIGNHTIESDSGFTAYVYGYGEIESFGYATGARLDNLNLEIKVFNKTKGVFSKYVCIGDELQLSVSSKRNFSEYGWVFDDGIELEGEDVSFTASEGGDFFMEVTGYTGAKDACVDQESGLIKITVLDPNFSIKGPKSVCPFSSGVEYFVEDNEETNIHSWFIEGGEIVSSNSGKSITVDWGDTNENSVVKLISQNEIGCISDTVLFPVIINVALEPSAPFGIDSLCSSGIMDIPYQTYETPTSIYSWQVAYGVVTKSGTTSETEITWNGSGIGKLWYEESSLLDDICSGVSDTLVVYIEREPIELLNIITEKSEYQLEEPIDFNFSGDENFNFVSWDFGTDFRLDSLKRDSLFTYFYNCPGLYELKATTYTGTVCDNLGLGIKIISIIDPNLEIFSVSHTLEDNIIEITGTIENLDFYSGEIFIQKKQMLPFESNYQQFENFQNTVINEINDSKNEIWNFQYFINTNCEIPISSLEHNNLRLLALSDSIKTKLIRNDYVNWKEGVLTYELWRKIDVSSYELVGEMDSEEYLLPYEYNGIDHCYRIKAIESGGNESFAWSNEACVSFEPRLTFYNIITPNSDQFNEFFVIEGIENYPNNELTIINRWGGTVFETNSYKNDWNGKLRNGSQLSNGVYYFLLDINEPRFDEQIIRGTITILK